MEFWIYWVVFNNPLLHHSRTPDELFWLCLVQVGNMIDNKKNSDFFWIYILECDNGNYYTGYTKDLAKRYQQHLKGTANSKYTRSFKPKRIAQCWQLFEDVGTVMKIERFIKSQTRIKKESLINAPEKLGPMLQERLNLLLKIEPFELSKITKAE